MTVTMFKAKLQRLRVTEADLYYEGSITLDEALLEAGGILPYEKVQVVNVNNGSRLETYAIPGPAGSRYRQVEWPGGPLGFPGGRSHCHRVCSHDARGDSGHHRPRVVLVDEENNPVDVRDLPAVESAGMLAF